MSKPLTIIVPPVSVKEIREVRKAVWDEVPPVKVPDAAKDNRKQDSSGNDQNSQHDRDTQ